MPKGLGQSGFSLVEMMIAITIAMIMSIGVLYIYSGQARTFFQAARKDQTSQEAAAAFELIRGLLREADICLVCTPAQAVNITYAAGIPNPNAATSLQLANDSISVTFPIPSGYDIWPNNTAPYINNTITLSWSSTGPNAGIVYAQAGAQPAVAIAGANGNLNTRIVNFDVWPQVVGAAGPVDAANVTDKPTAGYRIVLTASTGVPDKTYANALDPNGPLKNYRTVSYEGTTLPRNW